jgi:hypothetical protein
MRISARPRAASSMICAFKRMSGSLSAWFRHRFCLGKNALKKQKMPYRFRQDTQQK